jgi:hypothetical protein
MATLDVGAGRIAVAVRDAYEVGQLNGPRSFANVAWACRGIVS